MPRKVYKRYIKKAGDGKGILRTMNGAILDVLGLSEFLGVGQKAIRERVSRKEIPYRKLGGRIVFVRSEIEKFVEGLPVIRLDEVGKP